MRTSNRFWVCAASAVLLWGCGGENENSAPVVAPDSLVGQEDEELVIPLEGLLANDTDKEGNTLQVSSVLAAEHGLLNLLENEVVFRPDPNYNGPASFRYVVTDGVLSTEGVVSIEIASVNDNPVAVDDEDLPELVGTESEALVIPSSVLLANDTDIDEDTLSIVAVSDALSGTVELSGENVVFTPNASFSGVTSFVYTVRDGSADANATVKVVFTPTQDVLVAVDDATSTEEDVDLPIAASFLLANDTYTGDTPLVVAEVFNATNGVVSFNAATSIVTFSPDPDTSGVAGFEYTVTDGVLIDTAAVSVIVNEVNDAPVALDDTANTDEDIDLLLPTSTLLTNDTDIDSATLSVVDVSSPIDGTVTLDTVLNLVTFSPDANFNGTARFSYTLSDGFLTDTAFVTVEVAPINDPPTAVDDDLRIANGGVGIVQGTTGTIPLSTLLLNDSDIDNALVDLSIESVSSNNVSVSLQGTDVEVVVSLTAFVGTSNFLYTVSDGTDVDVGLVLFDIIAPTCGDGATQGTEECDDGNTLSGDGCSASCVLEFCGDGIVNDAGAEQCDDGNNIDTDSCHNNCLKPVIVQIAAGGEHTCSLTDAGTVTCWGEANFGQLGYGNQNDVGVKDDPATIGSVNVGGVVKQLATGRNHTCALTVDGKIRCWGQNTFGQLGYGNTNTIGDNEAPGSLGEVNVGGTATQIVAGNTHTCALLQGGKVRCWGQASSGQLGYGNFNSIGDNEPPSAAGDVPVGGTAVQLAVGDFHTCALLDTGNVRCWGSSSVGQLGYGNTTTIGDNEVPSSVGNVNVGGLVTQLIAGLTYTCALLDTGSLVCWGDASVGQLGYGNTTNIGDNETPATAGFVDVGGTISKIIAGSQHTCALLTDGNLRCWGKASSGQLGYGNTNNIGDNETPASVGNVNVGDLVTQVAAGNQHTCALLQDGNVKCWGTGPSGQLGYGDIVLAVGDDETPASVSPIVFNEIITQVVTGGSHACSLTNTGLVRCWGDNQFGQLGYANTNRIGDDEDITALPSVSVGGAVTQIALGTNHTCALLSNNTIRCWGNGLNGRLGYGNTNNIGDNETPASAGLVSVGNTVSAVTAGNTHTCALLTTGNVRCWGQALNGRLGYGNLNDVGDNEAPASVGDINVGGTVTQVSAGESHTCALLSTGNVRCWGLASSGQLGYGNTTSIGDNEAPSTAGDVNVGGTVTRIATGGFHTCALITGGTVRCWGSASLGQLGYGNITTIGDNETPASAGDVNVGGVVSAIVTGREHTCAITDTGLRCWGNNTDGRLGYGNTTVIGNDEVPSSVVAVDLGATASQVSAGTNQTCALFNGDSIRCWGTNNNGRLGYGTLNTFLGDDEVPADLGLVVLFQ